MTTNEPLIISAGTDNETGIPTLTVLTNIIQSYIVPVVASIGILSNLMSIVIFSRCKKRDISGMVQYLTLLAVSDLFNSIFSIVNWLQSGLISYGVTFRLITHSIIPCKILRFSEQVCLMMSGWILVLFSGERCIAVCMPLKLAQIVTDRRRRVALSATLAFVCVYHMKTLIFYEVYVDGVFLQCFWFPEIDADVRLVLSIANQVFSTLFPCCAVVILNSAIGGALYWRTKNKTIFVTASLSAAEKRCIVNLLGICLLYVVATVPSFTAWVHYNAMKLMGTANVDFSNLFRVAKFCQSLMVLNFAFNFLIYNASLDFYRNAMLSWFCHWRKTEPGNVNSGQTIPSSVGSGQN